MDLNDLTREALYWPSAGGRPPVMSVFIPTKGVDFCPFIENGSTVITWEGNLSPCMALLRNHTSYFDGRERFSPKIFSGECPGSKLKDLWQAPEYVSFRERVQTFDFSFCTSCGGCELSEANEEDCFGNTYPTCGGCLWRRE